MKRKIRKGKVYPFMSSARPVRRFKPNGNLQELPPLPDSPDRASPPSTPQVKRGTTKRRFEEEEADFTSYKYFNAEPYVGEEGPYDFVHKNPYAHLLATSHTLKYIDTWDMNRRFETSSHNDYICPLRHVRKGLQRYERKDNRISLVSMRVSGHLVPTLENVIEYSWYQVRMIVVYAKWSKQTGGTSENPPYFYEIFGMTGKDGIVAGDNIWTPLSLDSGQGTQYKVLLDKKWLLPPLGDLGSISTSYSDNGRQFSDKESMIFDEFIDLRGLHTQFNDQDLATEGNIYIMFLAPSEFVPIAYEFKPWKIPITCRIRFED